MDHYRHLFRVIEEIKPKRIMEIGTWDGTHARQMIHAAGPGCEYFGFDLFAPAPAYELSKPALPMSEVQKLLDGLGATVYLYPGDTRRTLRLACPLLHAMDMIFIDGGHSLATIQNDWEWSRTLMRRGSVALLDDYYPGNREAGALVTVERLQQDPALRVDVLQPPAQYGDLTVNMVDVRLA